MVTILVVNVYFCSLEKWLLGQSLLPCYQKLKNAKFTKRLEAATKDFSISFKSIFAHLGRAYIRGKNECKILLSLYIRLEYSFCTHLLFCYFIERWLSQNCEPRQC